MIDLEDFKKYLVDVLLCCVASEIFQARTTATKNEICEDANIKNLHDRVINTVFMFTWMVSNRMMINWMADRMSHWHMPDWMANRMSHRMMPNHRMMADWMMH